MGPRASRRALPFGGTKRRGWSRAVPVGSIQKILQFHFAPSFRPGAVEDGAAAMRFGGGVDADLADEAMRIMTLERLGGGIEDRTARRRYDDDVPRRVHARRHR